MPWAPHPPLSQSARFHVLHEPLQRFLCVPFSACAGLLQWHVALSPVPQSLQQIAPLHVESRPQLELQCAFLMWYRLMGGLGCHSDKALRLRLQTTLIWLWLVNYLHLLLHLQLRSQTAVMAPSRRASSASLPTQAPATPTARLLRLHPHVRHPLPPV